MCRRLKQARFLNLKILKITEGHVKTTDERKTHDNRTHCSLLKFVFTVTEETMTVHGILMTKESQWMVVKSRGEVARSCRRNEGNLCACSTQVQGTHSIKRRYLLFLKNENGNSWISAMRSYQCYQQYNLDILTASFNRATQSLVTEGKQSVHSFKWMQHISAAYLPWKYSQILLLIVSQIRQDLIRAVSVVGVVV